jgi:hypothetical protein
MLATEAESLTVGSLIKVDLSGALDGIRCIANGPLVLMDGDLGQIVLDGSFPTVTQSGIRAVRKYVVQFNNMGGLRMLLSPEELVKPFVLVHLKEN